MHSQIWQWNDITLSQKWFLPLQAIPSLAYLLYKTVSRISFQTKG
jgi:hypothetical protein